MSVCFCASVKLSDFGAASAYDRVAHPLLQRLEVRSYGWLVHDLLSWCAGATAGGEGELQRGELEVREKMGRLATACTTPDCPLEDVPTFERLVEQLDAVRAAAGW